MPTKESKKAFRVEVISLSSHQHYRIPDPVNFHQFRQMLRDGAGPTGKDLTDAVHPRPRVLLNQAVTLQRGEPTELVVDEELLHQLANDPNLKLAIIGEDLDAEKEFPADAPIQTHEDKLRAQRGDAISEPGVQNQMRQIKDIPRRMASAKPSDAEVDPRAEGVVDTTRTDQGEGPATLGQATDSTESVTDSSDDSRSSGKRRGR